MEAWAWNLISLATGFALLGVSTVFPFRHQEAKLEISWDIAGILAAMVFAVGADFLLTSALNRTLTYPSVHDWADRLHRWPFWLLLLGNLIIEDFLAYWVHRMMHSSAFWRTHAWHHSSKYLYWGSGLRATPFHILALFTPSYLLYLVFPSPETAAAGAVGIVASILTRHLSHSNIRVPFAKQVELVFVTPRFHFAHHSADTKRGNTNLGFTFTWWDRMFGTYTDPDTVPADDPLGLSYKASHWRMLLGLSARQEQASGRNTSVSEVRRS